MRAGDLERTAAAAAAVAVLAGALHMAQLWERLDHLLFDAFTVAAVARPQAAAPVVVVGIDEASFAELKLQWPWPREVHARLVDELTRAGASVVAFDVIFSEPSAAAADAALAAAIRRSGRVVLAGDVVLQDTAHFRGLQRVEPLGELRDAGAAVGIASIEVDADGVVRRFPRDPEALWRVALDLHANRTGTPPGAAPGPGALLRYSDGSDVGYVSYYQALDAPTMLPPGTFAGRIALVGLALKTSPDPSRRLADTHATPFLRFSRMYAPGVDLHAQFMASAHAGRAIVPLSWAWTAALAVLALASGVAAMRQWKAGRATAFTIAAAALLLAAAFGLFALSGLWLPVSLPIGLLLGLYLARGATAYVDELRRRRQIRRAFEFYVSPAVVAEMTAHPERLVLGGQRKQLTVMFTDLAGFTSMSEGIRPEEVAHILNEHLTRMTAIVLRHGGTIDKFIGDAVMAFWGAPLEDERHALHATQAAIDMQAEMDRWRREPGGPGQLHMRIGVNTGPMVVGNLGSKDRFDYTVIGDAVNLASRLESANRIYGTPILLTESVVHELGGRIAVRHVDRIRVKGKRDAIEIYTPAADAVLAEETEAALLAYRERRWERSEALWRDMLQRDPEDGVARLYLARIVQHRRDGVAGDWDGTFDLDQK